MFPAVPTTKTGSRDEQDFQCDSVVTRINCQGIFRRSVRHVGVRSGRTPDWDLPALQFVDDWGKDDLTWLDNRLSFDGDYTKRADGKDGKFFDSDVEPFQEFW